MLMFLKASCKLSAMTKARVQPWEWWSQRVEEKMAGNIGINR